MEVEKILDMMRNNKDILNPYYTGENSFNISEDGDIISLYIFTKDKADKEKEEKIRELFGADRVMYVEKDAQPAFYSIDFQRRRV